VIRSVNIHKFYSTKISKQFDNRRRITQRVLCFACSKFFLLILNFVIRDIVIISKCCASYKYNYAVSKVSITRSLA